MRTLAVAVTCLAIAAPIAIATFALQAQPNTNDEELVLAPVEESTRATEAPIALLPAPGSLAALAADDPAGAQALVRGALLSDPAILEEAVAALEVLREADSQAEIAGLIESNREALLSTEHASILGNPDGSVTLVEFLDYNCGFCKRAHADIVQLIEDNPDLRVLVKEFPVLGPGSLEASRVATAYRLLGGDMFAFIDRMLTEDQRPADADLAREVALSLGAVPADLAARTGNDSVLEAVSDSYALAEVFGITGTPAFVVGNELIMGAVGYDRLATAIQSAQANAQSAN